MKVIPAVDVLAGECVQLVGGDPETKRAYGSPVDLARRWESKGAETLHVIDLDATLGLGENTQSLADIIGHTGLDIQFGGGLRDREKIIQALMLGADRVIVGTLAVKDRENGFKTLMDINREAGGKKIIVSVDSLDGCVSIKGWQEQSRIRTTQLVEEAEEAAWGFLYTDVGVEGRMSGVNIDSIREVVDATDKPVIVSGGITTEKDVEDIRETGAWGIVLGKAIYEERLDFEKLI